MATQIRAQAARPGTESSTAAHVEQDFPELPLPTGAPGDAFVHAAGEHGPGKTPRQFGRLTLLKPLARGGMGEVFLATAGGIEGAERPCVVKIIRREHAQDKSFLARFFDEARIQAQLQHPGVAQVLEAATDPSGKPFVVVEYVEGRNLGEVRQRSSQLKSQISWADCVAMSVCIAEALAHVHERTDADGNPLEIVHRDLSPQNIMVGYGGEVKLIDFGTARGENRRCHTVSGIVYAKPGYVAPEVANNTPGGPAADLYALGVMLWELIAGRRFLSGDPSEHLTEVAAGRRVPQALALSINVPLELDTIIARLTAPRLQDRYSNAREALTDLVRVLKRAPSLANGERSVRGRIAHLMSRLYPVEPARSRAEFVRLLNAARQHAPARAVELPESPLPQTAMNDDGLFPGTRYRLLRQIARGIMGEVHEAEHIDLGRRVALKVLPRERCDNPEFEARFKSEARAIARIEHKNLVALHDFGVSSDGRPFYAMELLDGETLAKHMEREKPLGYKEAARLGLQVAAALEAAHQAGVIHRDIKPANLFLTRDGCVKLLDFGVAKSITERERASTDDALSFVGTPEYMAPEQASGEAVDERADIYALGAVLYEMVTGYLPHAAPTTIALLDKKTHAAPVMASRRSPTQKLPKSMDRLLSKALEIEPDARFASVKALRLALEHVLNERKTFGSRFGKRELALSALVLGGSLFGFAVTRMGTNLQVLAQQTWLAGEDSPETNNANTEHPALAQTSNSLTPAPAAQPESEEAFDALVEPQPAEAAAVEEVTPEQADEVNPEPTEPQEDEPSAKAAAPMDPASGKELGREDPIRQGIERAEAYMLSDRAVAALAAYRKLGSRFPEEGRILEGWSNAAAKTNGWGEALRVAIRWAAVDTSAEAQLHLAKIQRRVGQRYGAIATLKRLLEAEPNNADARALLQRFGSTRFAMSQQ